MKLKIATKSALMLALSAALTGCGGSDEQDLPPELTVAASASVKEKRTVTVTATATDDKEQLSFSWSQKSGPTLTLSNTNSAIVSITAPAVDADTTAVLEVKATDNAGQAVSKEVSVQISNNKAPMVSAAAVSGAEKTSINLAATATDSDGTVASYQWVQKSGPAVTLQNATTATPQFIAPSVTANTPISFTLTVTDDDSDQAVTEVAVTVQQQWQSFSLNGALSASAFAEATVKGKVAGQEFSSVANAQGEFSLDVKVDDDETNFFTLLEAKAKDRAGISYHTVLPTLTAAQVAPQSEGQSSFSFVAQAESTSNEVKLNDYSTSIFALITQANGGVVPADLASYRTLEKTLVADEIIEAAAVTKLLVDGGGFQLPEGVSSILALLTNTESYNAFVSAAEAANPGIIASTVEQVVNDPSLVQVFTAADLPESYFEFFASGGGFLPTIGKKYNFESDGSGTVNTAQEYNPWGTRVAESYKWSVADGSLQLEFLPGNEYEAWYPISQSVLALSDEQVAELRSHGVSQVQVHMRLEKTVFKRLMAGELFDSFRMSSFQSFDVLPISYGDKTLDPAPVITELKGDLMLKRADKLQGHKFVKEQMVGSWSFRHLYSFAPEVNSEPVEATKGSFIDLVELKADGTGFAAHAEQNLNWSVNAEGALEIEFSKQCAKPAGCSYSRLHLTKLDQQDNQLMLFSTQYDEADQVIEQLAYRAVKIDKQAALALNPINKDEHYWQGMLNLRDKACWNGSVPVLYCYGFPQTFGWQLQDGQAALEHYTDANGQHINRKVISWQQLQQDDADTIEIVRTQAGTTRRWQVLNVENAPAGRRLWTMEYQLQRIGGTNAPFRTAIMPRLGISDELPVSLAKSAQAASATSTRLVVEATKDTALSH